MTPLAPIDEICSPHEKEYKLLEDGVGIGFCKKCKRLLDIVDPNVPQYKRKKITVR